MTIENRGIQPLTISAISSVNGNSGVGQELPAVISGKERTNFDVYVYPNELGIFSDTLLIVSNDPGKPEIMLPIAADVQNIFLIIDNEDSLNYFEFGNWFNSNAQAYGPSSRYASLGNSAQATFTTSLEKNGIYDIYQILPTTVNAANNALYCISIAGVLLDSLYLDQNVDSGDWVKLGRYFLPANVSVDVTVIDVGGNNSSRVLRTDAIKFSLIQEISNVAENDWQVLPKQFEFDQNFPNPFNAITTFRYALARQEDVSLQVYNNLGQVVATLVNQPQSPGYYDVNWQTDGLASGVYFARFQSGTFVKIRKLMLLK